MEKYSVTFNKTKSQLQMQQAVKKTSTSKGAAAKLMPLHPVSFLPGKERFQLFLQMIPLVAASQGCIEGRKMMDQTAALTEDVNCSIQEDH